MGSCSGFGVKAKRSGDGGGELASGKRDMQRNMALGYHPLLQSVAGYEGLRWADPVPSTDG